MGIKKRFLLAVASAAVVLGTFPASASVPQMRCSEPLEAVCVAIGTACRAIDTVESKVLAKDLINCNLG